MRPYTTIIVAALAAQQCHGFQSVISRKDLISNIATASSIILLPNVASAAETKAGTKAPLRGGKNASDALHNGTDLNKVESAVAGGLMEKMGLPDIAPDKDSSSRAPPSRIRKR
eukprot:scaffold83778_cov73-Cyclotella_meneghiniana.AAC.6